MELLFHFYAHLCLPQEVESESCSVGVDADCSPLKRSSGVAQFVVTKRGGVKSAENIETDCYDPGPSVSSVLPRYTNKIFGNGGTS